MDCWLYLILLVTLVSGMLATLSNIPGTFDYRETISSWFRSVLLLAMLFPFTRLVHCLSLPLEYFSRRDIIYRRK